MVGGVVGDLFEILIGRLGSYIILGMIALSLGILITEQSLAKIGNGLLKLGKWLGSLMLHAGKKGIESAGGEQIKLYNDNLQKDRQVRKEERAHINKEKQKDMLAKATLLEAAGKDAANTDSKKLFDKTRTTKPSKSRGGLNLHIRLMVMTHLTKLLDKKRQQEPMTKRRPILWKVGQLSSRQIP